MLHPDLNVILDGFSYLTLQKRAFYEKYGATGLLYLKYVYLHLNGRIPKTLSSPNFWKILEIKSLFEVQNNCDCGAYTHQLNFYTI